MFRVLLVLFGIFVVTTTSSPSEFVLPLGDWFEDFIVGPPLGTQFIAVQIHTAALLAADLINSNNSSYSHILPNTKLILDTKIYFFSPELAEIGLIEFAEEGNSLAVGYSLSTVATKVGIVSAVYDVAILASLAQYTPLNDKNIYPYFTRISPAGSDTSNAMVDSILYFKGQSEYPDGWVDVAVISEVTTVTTDWAENIIAFAEPELNLVAYRQFLTGEEDDIVLELNQVKLSGARVIFAPVFDQYANFIETANEIGLVGEGYVWITIPTVVSFPFTESQPLMRGTLGIIDRSPPNPLQEAVQQAWQSPEAAKYPTAGPGTFPHPIIYRPFDMIVAAAMAIEEMDRQGRLDSGERIPAADWTELIRSLRFEGSSGFVSFTDVGDRIGEQNLMNYNPETNSWDLVGIWSPVTGISLIADVVWFSNTTTIPDLDIREPFDYWSCHNKEKRRDETGKQIQLSLPGSEDVDNIASDYYCDRFLDCQNLSDESGDCEANYTILFIVFGIITGIMILISIGLIFFVILFGVALDYRRLRSASPVFLILILLSMIFGYGSIYAWFGKPHPVACGFQPWLLGLAVNGMIAALCVKNFRIWRIFKDPMKRLRITDLELMVLWIVIMIPSVIILVIWTIVATPTASLEERDEKQHFVCSTGGFVGAPGGYIFFGIFVAYCSFILLIGAILSYLVRNVPSQFNESKILTISIYNLGFLSVVIIPVFLVVQPFNPFLAWILRTLAILYAFTATMVLLFVPMVVGLIIFDKGRNVKKFKSKLAASAQPTSSGQNNSSDTRSQ